LDNQSFRDICGSDILCEAPFLSLRDIFPPERGQESKVQEHPCFFCHEITITHHKKAHPLLCSQSFPSLGGKVSRRSESEDGRKGGISVHLLHHKYLRFRQKIKAITIRVKKEIMGMIAEEKKNIK